MEGSVRIFKPSVELNLGNSTYPCVDFRMDAWVNRPSQATVSITSNEINGGRFTKDSALEIAREFQEKVLKTGVNGSININSGNGQIGFKGLITGCQSFATASGGLRLEVSLIHEDVQLMAFCPSVFISITEEGRSKLAAAVKEANNKYKLNSAVAYRYAPLISDKGGSLSDRIKRLLDVAIKYAEKYPIEESKDTIKDAIKVYDKYVKDFLTNSNQTSLLFNGLYEPSTPQENAAINAFIEKILFLSNNFWSALQYLFNEYGMCYSSCLISMGKIINQDFRPEAKSTNISGNYVRTVGMNSSNNLGIATLPTTRVTMDINLDPRFINKEALITVSYTNDQDKVVGTEFKLEPKSFLSAVRGSIEAKGINVQELAKRSAKINLSKPNKELDKYLKMIKSAALVMCENQYYFLKYVNSRAMASVYFSGANNVFTGSRVSIANLRGNLEGLHIQGNSNGEGINCTAFLCGVKY